MVQFDATGGKFDAEMKRLQKQGQRLAMTPRRPPAVTGTQTNRRGAAQLVSPNRLPRRQAQAATGQQGGAMQQPPAPQVLNQGNATDALQAPAPNPFQGNIDMTGRGSGVQTPTGAIATQPAPVINPNDVGGRATQFAGQDVTGRQTPGDILNTGGPTGFENIPDPATTVGTDLQSVIDALLAGTGGADTEAQKLAAEERARAALGQSLADTRASMGVMGFGGSGAAQSIEGGLRNQMARGLTEESLAIDQAASDDLLNRQLAGIGAAMRDRELDMDEEQFALILDALNGGGDGDGGDGGGDGFGVANPFDPEGGGVLETGSDIFSHGMNAIGAALGEGGENNFVKSIDDVPQPSTKIRSEFGFTMYRGADNNHYWVPDDRRA